MGPDFFCRIVMAVPPGLSIQDMTPTSPPPGLGSGPCQGAGSPAQGSEYWEVLPLIAEQVKQLLAKARRDSEAKVKAELKVMHDKIAEMDAALDLMMDALHKMQESQRL